MCDGFGSCDDSINPDDRCENGVFPDGSRCSSAPPEIPLDIEGILTHAYKLRSERESGFWWPDRIKLSHAQALIALDQEIKAWQNNG